MLPEETFAVLRSAQPIGVSVVYNSRDQATGEAFVEFSNEVDLQRCMLISHFFYETSAASACGESAGVGAFCISMHVLTSTSCCIEQRIGFEQGQHGTALR